MTVTSKHRSCQLVPKNGISKSAGHLKIPNLYSKFREKMSFKYSRFKEKDSNIRIIFELKNCRIQIRIFEIRGKRFESKSSSLLKNVATISKKISMPLLHQFWKCLFPLWRKDPEYSKTHQKFFFQYLRELWLRMKDPFFLIAYCSYSFIFLHVFPT